MTNLIPFASYVLAVTFSPGPNNITSMAIANRYGFKETMGFRYGAAVGFYIIMMLCNYFNLYLFNLIPRIKPIMGLLAACYMLYLAYKILKSDNSKVDNNTIEPISFYSGIFLQLLNFKGTLFAITLASTFIIPNYQSLPEIMLASLLVVSSAFASINCWGLFGYLFQRLLNQYRKQFNYIMACLIVYSAYVVSGLDLHSIIGS